MTVENLQAGRPIVGEDDVEQIISKHLAQDTGGAGEEDRDLKIAPGRGCSGAARCFR